MRSPNRPIIHTINMRNDSLIKGFRDSLRPWLLGSIDRGAIRSCDDSAIRSFSGSHMHSLVRRLFMRP